MLEKHEASSTSPQEIFKTKDEYKDFAFDERGVPTHDKGGKELPKNAKKVCSSSDTFVVVLLLSFFDARNSAVSAKHFVIDVLNMKLKGS